MLTQSGSIEAVGTEAVEQPAFSTIQLRDEDLLVVPMQIEAVAGAPSRVDVDFRPAAEERFERFSETGQRLVNFVDGIEGQGRATSELLGHLSGANSVPEGTFVGVGASLEVVPLPGKPEPIRFAPVMLQDPVENRPRQESRKAVRRTAAPEVALKPIAPQELVGRHGFEERGQHRRATILYCAISQGYVVKCLFG